VGGGERIVAGVGKPFTTSFMAEVEPKSNASSLLSGLMGPFGNSFVPSGTSTRTKHTSTFSGGVAASPASSKSPPLGNGASSSSAASSSSGAAAGAAAAAASAAAGGLTPEVVGALFTVGLSAVSDTITEINRIINVSYDAEEEGSSGDEDGNKSLDLFDLITPSTDHEEQPPRRRRQGVEGSQQQQQEQ